MAKCNQLTSLPFKGLITISFMLIVDCEVSSRQSRGHTIPTHSNLTCRIWSRAAVRKSVEDLWVPAVFSRRITNDDSTQPVNGGQIWGELPTGLQTAKLHSVQFQNCATAMCKFWPKPDPNPNLTLAKLCSATCKLWSPTKLRDSLLYSHIHRTFSWTIIQPGNSGHVIICSPTPCLCKIVFVRT